MQGPGITPVTDAMVNRDTQIILLHRQGLSTREIAKQVCCDHTTCWRVICRADKPRRTEAVIKGAVESTVQEMAELCLEGAREAVLMGLEKLEGAKLSEIASFANNLIDKWNVLSGRPSDIKEERVVRPEEAVAEASRLLAALQEPLDLNQRVN